MAVRFSKSHLRRIGLGVLAGLFILHGIFAWQARQKILLEDVFPALKLKEPNMLAVLPDEPQTFVIVEKCGVIKWASRKSNANGTFLDLSAQTFCQDDEEGMGSIAFDPNYKENKFVYVFYSMKKPYRVRVSRFTMTDKHTVDPGSELLILEVDKPDTWHKGGMLAFDEQGYLFIGIGEGRIPERAQIDRILQSRKSLLGAILRIDVREASVDAPYKIPPDNPFVRERGARGEIWAYGFRNPWRFSFSPKGELIVGDVGGVRWEEIDIVEKGKHYGWPIVEGRKCHYSTDHDRCDRSGKEYPVAAFPNNKMQAMIGGYVYAGEEIPTLRGKYIFAGFEKGIYAIDLNVKKGETLERVELLLQNPVKVEKKKRILGFSSFGVDDEGELYVCDFNRGGVYKLVALQEKLQWYDFALLLSDFRKLYGR